MALNREPEFPRRQGKFRLAGKFFLREYQDKRITGIPTRENILEINEKVPDMLIDIQGKVGMKLSDIPEQDSYSYASAFVYLGADSQKELLDKYRKVGEMLRFSYEDLTIPLPLPQKARQAAPENDPRIAVQVLSSPIELPEREDTPLTGGMQDLLRP
jgi:hypothetical protein